MDETRNTKKRLSLQTQLHSLNVTFDQNTLQKLASFPPLYVRLTRGTHAVDSTPVSLLESSRGSCHYLAVWEQETLPLAVGLIRDGESGEYETKHVKFLLKIFSEGKPTHKTLATYTLDVASLNLSSLDILPSFREGQRLECLVGKNAAGAISSVTLDVTLHFSFAHDQSAQSRDGTPTNAAVIRHPSPVSSPSPVASSTPQPSSPVPTLTEHHPSHDHGVTNNHEPHPRTEAEREAKRQELLVGSGPYDRLSSIRVDQESQEGSPVPPVTSHTEEHSTRETSELEEQTTVSMSMSVDLGDGLPPGEGKKKSKAKKLKGIFKLKGAKSKGKSKGKGQDPKLEKAKNVSFENGFHKSESIEEPLDSHSLEPDFELEFKKVIHSPVKTSPDVELPTIPTDSTEPQKMESLPNQEAEIDPDSCAEAPKAPITSTVTSDSSGYPTVTETNAKPLLVVDDPLLAVKPIVGPPEELPPFDNSFDHHSEPTVESVPAAQPPASTKPAPASGPPPKPKRRGRTPEPSPEPSPLITAKSVEHTATDIPAVANGHLLASPEDYQGLETRRTSGTSLTETNDTTRGMHRSERANQKETMEPPVPAVRSSSPRLLSITPSPAVTPENLSRERSQSPEPTSQNNGGLHVNTSEPVSDSPRHSRSINVSPAHREQAPVHYPASGIIESGILASAIQANTHRAGGGQLFGSKGSENASKRSHLVSEERESFSASLEFAKVTVGGASSGQLNQQRNRRVSEPTPPRSLSSSPSHEASQLKDASSANHSFISKDQEYRRVSEPIVPRKPRSSSGSPAPRELSPVDLPKRRHGVSGPTPSTSSASSTPSHDYNQPEDTTSTDHEHITFPPERRDHGISDPAPPESSSSSFSEEDLQLEDITLASDTHIGGTEAFPRRPRGDSEPILPRISRGSPSREDPQLKDAKITKATQQRDRSTSEPTPIGRLRTDSGSPLVSQKEQERKDRVATPKEAPPTSVSPYSHGAQQQPKSGGKKVSKLLSGSTPVLMDPRKSPGKKFSSTSDLSGVNSTRILTGDLVVRPVRSSTVENLLEKTSSNDQILHGLLRVQVLAVNLGDAPQGPRYSLQETVLNPDMIRDLPEIPEESEDGLFCVFTINGGNSRAETSTQVIVPRRPVRWEDEKEFLFYTNQMRQVFIMCRKTKLDDPRGPAVGRHKAKKDACIGAAILSISDLKPSLVAPDSRSTNMIHEFQRHQLEAITLPLQPKGNILLRTSFGAWEPRLKVSCKGTVTIQSLSGVDCSLDHDISCTVKIDSEFQDCTAVMNPEDCEMEGWQDEPIEFNAYCNMHCDIQVWAYSSEETEYWCGGCLVPLALALSPEDVRYHMIQSQDRDGPFVVTSPYEKTLTLPVEPQGILTLSFLLYPSPRSSPIPPPAEPVSTAAAANEPSTSPQPSGESGPAGTAPTEGPDQPQPASGLSRNRTWRGKSLRRNLTIKRTAGLDLQVPKTYTEEPFTLQQENTDLKREVEFLRAELREAKSKLAESEFFRERSLMELKTLQDEVEELKGHQKPSSKWLKKRKQKNKK